MILELPINIRKKSRKREDCLQWMLVYCEWLAFSVELIHLLVCCWHSSWLAPSGAQVDNEEKSLSLSLTTSKLCLAMSVRRQHDEGSLVESEWMCKSETICVFPSEQTIGCAASKEKKQNEELERDAWQMVPLAYCAANDSFWWQWSVTVTPESNSRTKSGSES